MGRKPSSLVLRMALSEVSASLKWMSWQKSLTVYCYKNMTPLYHPVHSCSRSMILKRNLIFTNFFLKILMGVCQESLLSMNAYYTHINFYFLVPPTYQQYLFFTIH